MTVTHALIQGQILAAKQSDLWKMLLFSVWYRGYNTKQQQEEEEEVVAKWRGAIIML
eukprot:jgi/Psemu1/311409/fgenesh1_kg.765_\